MGHLFVVGVAPGCLFQTAVVVGSWRGGGGAGWCVMAMAVGDVEREGDGDCCYTTMGDSRTWGAV